MSGEFRELRELCKKAYGESTAPKHITNFSFKVLENVLPKKESIMRTYGITDCEMYVLLLLEGFHTEAIQQFSIKTNEFTEKCRCYLNSLLSKTPQTKSDVLYRQEDLFRIDMEKMEDCLKKGIPYIHSCYMTASTDDYDNKDCKFIVTPLKNGNTKAHDIYLIYNQGEDYGSPENQVEFELGTKFLIDKIEGTTIFMHEIE